MKKTYVIMSLLLAVLLAFAVNVGAADGDDDDGEDLECCCEVTCYYQKLNGDNATLAANECFKDSETLVPIEMVCDEEIACNNLKLSEPGGQFWRLIRYEGKCSLILCSAGYLLGCGDPRLATLRQLRDEVLSVTAAGRTLIGLYYDSSDVLIELFEANPGLKNQALQLLETLVPIIGSSLNR